MKEENFYVGVSEIDIAPDVGTLLAGGIKPRVSIGVEDPLYVKSIVIETEKGDKCVKLAS
ncbi:MAG: hypothetical protein NC926_06270 [Candidatus Omnitrophica bacterium]|nr:hypothetical protein [Candidatus Omnitrophota bacterium]MCM8807533.1 hypothetical protein [Candidatus Omnitrophota bacterium]